MIVEGMSGNSLVTMYGEPELMGRSFLSRQIRKAQKKIVRPIGHGVGVASRNKLVKKGFGMAARAGAAYVTGGASEAALLAAKSGGGMFAKGSRGLSRSSLATAARTLSNQVSSATGGRQSFDLSNLGDRLKRAGQAAVDTLAPPADEPHNVPAIPQPLIYGGAALAVAAVAFFMLKKKGK